jgi:hypothetical protein
MHQQQHSSQGIQSEQQPEQLQNHRHRHASSPPQTGQMYDVVIASEVVEHVRRPDRFCVSLASVLRPGGYVVWEAIPQHDMLCCMNADIDRASVDHVWESLQSRTLLSSPCLLGCCKGVSVPCVYCVMQEGCWLSQPSTGHLPPGLWLLWVLSTYQEQCPGKCMARSESALLIDELPWYLL